MRLMRAAAPRMAAARRRADRQRRSSAGKRPSLTNAAYSVTKAAQLSLSRAFADAYAADGVLVNAVAPGPVSRGAVDRRGRPGRPDRRGTAGRVRATRMRWRRRRRTMPLGRFAEPEEIAA